MITGDKQETAINIAISCKLIRQPDSLLICNETSEEAAAKRLEVLASKLQEQYAPLASGIPAPHAGQPSILDLLFIPGLSLFCLRETMTLMRTRSPLL